MTSPLDKVRQGYQKATKPKPSPAPRKASPAAAEEADKRPVPKPPKDDLVPAYYDTTKGKFYVQNDRGDFHRIDKDTLSLELRSAGFYTSYKHDNGLTYLEGEILRITKRNAVQYAGPLAGFSPGCYEFGTSDILVTEGPRFIKPVPGQWPFFRVFLTQLLGDQARYFCAWMKWALTSLKRGLPWSPGQLFAIAGTQGCGKSFLQTLVTEMLGGRVSKPYDYLAGKSNFNADIMEAEHGLIGDESPHTDIRSRRALGSMLKNLIANKEQSVHGKNKQAKCMSPFIRLTMSMNDNHEGLMALPPLDSDVADKIILVKATPVKFPWPSKRFPDSQTYYQKLREELPHFLYYLNRWQIPESLRCQRYGVVSFKNEELMEEMDSLSPEWRLWSLIEQHVFGDDEHKVWEGTSAELDECLRTSDRSGVVGRLLYYDTACGQYLARLAKKSPLKVAFKKLRARKVLFRISRQDNRTTYI